MELAKRKAALGAAETNADAAKKTRFRGAVEIAYDPEPAPAENDNDHSGSTAGRSGGERSTGGGGSGSSGGGGGGDGGAESFANAMRHRPVGAARLTKAEKKQMRKEWKKAQQRRARGLDPDGSDGDDNDADGAPGGGGAAYSRAAALRNRGRGKGGGGGRNIRGHASPSAGAGGQLGDFADGDDAKAGKCKQFVGGGLHGGGWRQTTVVQMVKARGPLVRALGGLLGTNWTGEMMQKVMIIYGHVFFTAVISNLYAAADAETRTHLNDSVALPLGVTLAFMGVVSLWMPMHWLLAAQGILFGTIRMLYSIGWLPASVELTDRRDMAVWSLVMCVCTFVAASISVARLGTTPAVTHGGIGFPASFLLGRVCSCYVLGKATHAVTMAYAAFSFVTMAAAAASNDSAAARGAVPRAAPPQVFRRKGRRNKRNNHGQGGTRSAEGGQREEGPVAAAAAAGGGVVGGGGGSGSSSGSGSGGGLGNGDDDASGEEEPDFEVHVQSRGSRRNPLRDTGHHVWLVLTNSRLLVVNALLSATVSRSLFHKDMVDPNVFQNVCPGVDGVVHPGSVFQPEGLIVPLRFVRRSYLSFSVVPAVYLLITRQALSLVHSIQLALFGLVVCHKCYLDAAERGAQDADVILFLEGAMAFAVILFMLVFELTTRLESPRRIGLALVLQLFVARAVAMVLDMASSATFLIPEATLGSFVFSLIKLPKLVDDLRLSAVLLDDGDN